MTNTVQKQEQAHTPGPWSVGKCGGNIYAADGKTIVCYVYENTELRGAEAEANARLIAAAPELLVALKALVKAVEAPDEDSIMELRAAHVAIAGATS